MQREPVMQRVRAGIVRVLNDLGFDGPKPLEETLLVRDGHYCGRRFIREDATAVWFHEEGEVKFYSADGSLVDARPIDQIVTPPDDRRVA